jgi:hypothetical protein
MFDLGSHPLVCDGAPDPGDDTGYRDSCPMFNMVRAWRIREDARARGEQCADRGGRSEDTFLPAVINR